MRKTEPHQKNSRAIPPSTGPTALPAEKAPIQTPIATVRFLRVLEHVKDQRQRRGREGRAGDPEGRSADDEHLRRGRKGTQQGRDPECRRADEQEPTTADPIA